MKQLMKHLASDIVRFLLVSYFIIGDPRYIVTAFALNHEGTTASSSSFSTSFPDITGTSAGYLNGSFSVNEGGSAVYQISIAVPPGTNGMEPKLSIVYDSRGTNGLMGIGFALSGLSSITRCPTTKVQDGFVDAVDFDDNDKFCIDGQRLVVVSGEYGADGAEYRTENETFSKIISYSGSINGPERWVVKTKSGLIYDYGDSSNSRVEAPGRPEVSLWLVNKVKDSVGNYQTFHYNDNTQNGGSYPVEIRYGGNDSMGTPSYNRVVFEYESRNDPQVRFANGTQIKIPKRIAKIKTLADEATAWEYSLHYDTSSYSGKSQLKSVTECDADGNCMLPTEFKWQENEIGFGESTKLRDASPHGGAYNYPEYKYDNRTYVKFQDMNGDLLPDRLSVQKDGNSSEGLWIEINNGNGFDEAINWWPQGTTEREHFPESANSVSIFHTLMDMNRDGLPDRVGYLDRRTEEYGIWVALNNGNGFDENKRWHLFETNPGLYNRLFYKNGSGETIIMFRDMNGDQLPDRVSSHNPDSTSGTEGLWVWINNGEGFNTPVNWWDIPIVGNANYPAASNAAGQYQGLIDMDSDGLPDRVSQKHPTTSEVGFWVRRNTGSGFESPELWLETTSDVYARITHDSNHDGTGNIIQLQDMNGDGLPDRVGAMNENGSGAGGMWVALNNGHGFQDLTFWYTSPGNGFNWPTYHVNSSRHTSATLIDITGDGLPDRVTARAPASFAESNLWVAVNKGNSFGPFQKWLPENAYADISVPEYRTGNGTLFSSMDINADGFLDRIGYIDAYTHSPGLSVLTNPGKPELLTGITTGHNHETSIEYTTLMDADTYTKDTDATYPIRDIRAPMNIVKSYSVDNGVGGSAKTSFKYYGLKAHVEGRGMCGFRKVETTNEVSGITTTTYYRQDHPYKSLAFRVETRLDDGTLIKEVEDTWDVKNFDYESYFPHVRQSVVKDYQLNGAILSQTTTTKEFDDYGNVETLTVSELGGYSTTTLNEYDQILGLWHIDRLRRSSVTKTIPGKPSITKSAEFEYNPSGLLTMEVNNAYTEHQLKKEYKHDFFGNIKESITSGWGTDFLPIRQYTYYDDKGQFAIRSKNHLGQEETKDYDNRHGKVESLIGPNGIPTNWQYDGFGRTIYEYKADGTQVRTLQFLVDESVPDAPLGAIYYIRTDATGATPAIAYYDILDREIRKEEVGFDGTKIFVDTVYNERGEVKKVSDPYFKGDTVYWTINEYDLLGRLVKTTDGTRSPTRMIYNGLITTAINPLGQKEIREENNIGQLIKTTDNLNNSLLYEYDADGNLVKTTDPAGNVTTMGYDTLGNKTWMEDPDTGRSEYDYNALGQLLRQEDALGQVVTYTYDVLGRMVTRSEAEGISQWEYDTKWVGALSSVTSAGEHFKEFFYDELGRIEVVETTIDGNYFSVETDYDLVGRVDSVTYPRSSGAPFRVAHSYNEFGYLKSVYNDRDSAEVYWEADVMNARGQLEQSTLGNGLTTNKNFNPVTGHIREIKTGGVQDLSLSFDILGNLKKRADNIVGASEVLHYDEINRLVRSDVNYVGASDYEPVDHDVSSVSDEDISVSGMVVGASSYEPSNTVTVSYDALGNILTKSDTGTYRYGENGAGPHAVTSIYGDMSNSYDYDANGNRTSDNFGSVDYSSYNKPVRITKGQEEVHFEYSAGRSRYKQIKKKSGGVYNTKYYVGGIYEKEISASGTTKEKYFIKAGGSSVAIKIKDSLRGEKLLYLLKDHLGSVQTITNTLGLVTEVLSFDAWGKRRNADWSASPDVVRSEIDRGFTGHEQLDTVGLVHMNGRVYDPQIGRFLSADPFIQAPENLQSYNRYSYVLNNPLSYSDPSGFFFKKLFKKIKSFVKGIVQSIRQNPFAFVAAIAIAALTAGWASGLSFNLVMGSGFIGAPTFAQSVLISAISGGITGSIAGATAAAVSGGNASSILTAGLKGGLTGGLGKAFNTGSYALNRASTAVRVVAHGAKGAVGSLLNGGKAEHGFVSGAFMKLAESGLGKITEKSYVQSSASTSGASVAQDAGGSFANGAVTESFKRLHSAETNLSPLRRVVEGIERGAGGIKQIFKPGEKWLASNLKYYGNKVAGGAGFGGNQTVKWYGLSKNVGKLAERVARKANRVGIIIDGVQLNEMSNLFSADGLITSTSLLGGIAGATPVGVGASFFSIGADIGYNTSVSAYPARLVGKYIYGFSDDVLDEAILDTYQ